MGFFEAFFPKAPPRALNVVPKSPIGSLAVRNQPQLPAAFQPTGKGKTKKDKAKFRQDIGEDHPVDFQQYENAYLTVPIIQGAVDKMVDFVVGPGFYVTSGNPQAVTACENFFNRHAFQLFLEQIVRNVLVYGSAFAEIVPALNPRDVAKLKVLDPKSMYVKRDEYGVVKGYTQHLTGFGSQKVDFLPNEVLHFILNPIADSAYGTSTLRAIMGNGSQSALEQKLNIEESVKTILDRRANAPLHVKIGTDEYQASPVDTEAFAAGLEAMKNRTDWVTDHRVEINAIGFEGKVLDQSTYLEHAENNIMYALQVPEVMLGKGSIPEGLAEVQMEAFERRVHSIQENVEKVLEDDLLNPWLKRMGLVGVVEFEWGSPTPEDEEKEIDKFVKLLALQLEPSTRVGIENKLRKVLGIEGEIQAPAVNQNAPLGIGSFPHTGTAPSVPSLAPMQPNKPPFFTVRQNVVTTAREGYTPYTDLSEALVREYNVHDRMTTFVQQYDFHEINDARERAAAKSVFQKGVPQGWSQRELARELARLIADKEQAELIAQTELARIESEASLAAYEASDKVEEAKWMTAEDEKVCLQCGPQDGKRFSLEQAREMIPLHPRCRCAWAPVV